MEKLKLIISLLFAVFLLGSRGHALELQKIQKIQLNWDFFKEQNSYFGGISGMIFKNNQFWAISDDRGRKDKPRIFIFDIVQEKNSFRLKPHRVLYVAPHQPQFYMDGEALAEADSQTLILSSEGDHNSKPRKMPRLFEIDLQGHVKKDLSLPDYFLPPPSGLQKKGLQSNSGFEAMTAAHGFVWAAAERPLKQDLSPTMSGGHGNEYLRWLQFSKKNSEDTKSTWVVDGEYFYPLSPDQDPGQLSFQKGLTEMIFLGDQKFLVLERELQFSLSEKIHFKSQIFEVNLKNARLNKPSSLIASSSLEEKNIIQKKNLNLISPADQDNYEVLSFGPSLENGHRTIWVGSDNNLSKDHGTQFLIFEVKE